jgi:hypothetical protein
MYVFYKTARSFLKGIPRQPSSKQTALIPWVQSIVIQHYVLGKTVFFQGQNNYIEYHTYLEGDDPSPTCYSIYPQEYINWDPDEQPPNYYKGFSVPTFNKNVATFP